MIRRCITIVLSTLVFAFAASSAQAQVAQAKGKASVPYAAASAPADAKAKALVAAELKAIEGYYAQAGEAESANFDGIRDQIAANLDRYVLDSTVLAESDDVAAKRYTVTVRVELNVAKLRIATKANSAVGKAGRSEKSQLAFVFVSRQVDSEKAFDDRIYKRVDATVTASGDVSVSRKGTEGEKITKSQVATNASVDAQARAKGQATATTESGGSTTRKATETTWKLLPSADIDTLFLQTFTGAGFKALEAADVEEAAKGLFHVSAIEDDYRSGNDLKSATRQTITRGMRVAGVPYVAIGTLDVGLPMTDPQTGLFRVAVTVNAKMLDVTQNIAETLASVGPTQFAGSGPTEAEARTNALKLAANSTARELASQLTSQGIH